MTHRRIAFSFVRLAVVAGLLVFCTGFSAPAAAADKETRQMMADIRMLQEQTQQLQNLIGSLSKSMNEAVDTAVKTMSARIDARLGEQAATTNQAFANQKLSIDGITHDVATLREKVDENSVRVGTLSQEVTALRQLVTQLNARPAGYDPVLGVPDGVPGQPAAAAGGGLGMSPSAAFDHAYGDYTAGQYDLAIQGFEAYIKDFATSQQADDAQVTICRSYLNMANNAKAVEACDIAIRSYPSGDRLAEAYYVKGLALNNLNRRGEARAAFEYIVKTFPTSGEASLAATKLMTADPVKKP